MAGGRKESFWLYSIFTIKYTFLVPSKLDKFQIRKLIEETFEVKVEKVRTANKVGRTKRTVYGKKKTIKSQRKTVITLKGKDTIDIFETKEK